MHVLKVSSGTSYNTIFTLWAIRPSIRQKLDVIRRGISVAWKHIQPDTSNSLTASRPPFGLKGVGRREYKNVIRHTRKPKFVLPYTMISYCCDQLL